MMGGLGAVPEDRLLRKIDTTLDHSFAANLHLVIQAAAAGQFKEATAWGAASAVVI
jgi:hypothetical protein